MTLYRNPFSQRAAHHLKHDDQFVSNFGPGIIGRLPDDVWDRLLIVRSAKGGGKSSLMRIFSAGSLNVVRQKYPETAPVRQALAGAGVLDGDEVRRLGVVVSLDRDYRALLDLSEDPGVVRKLFFRLLDARVIVGIVKAALEVSGLQYPRDLSTFSLVPNGEDPRTEVLLARVGGGNGRALVQFARSVERQTIRMVDAVLPTSLGEDVLGHSELYSLELLTGCRLSIRGGPLAAQPLLMFDDGHKLGPDQRLALLDALRRRDTAVARWYAERFEALSEQELLGEVGEEDRDYVLLRLEPRGDDRAQQQKFESFLIDVAHRRGHEALLVYAQERSSFTEMLSDDRDAVLSSCSTNVVSSLANRVRTAADESLAPARYQNWLDSAKALAGWDAAVRWRELEVLMARDRDRQPDLFGEALPAEEAQERSNAGLREAAAIAVANEFDVPYFAGPRMLAKLGGLNVEQFLEVCGALFDRMLTYVSIGRDPRLSVEVQDRVIRKASNLYWERVRREVPCGADIQLLIEHIVDIARLEEGKPKVPYPPGVTGTALLMVERDHLLDENFRRSHPGADRLFHALASAVAHNVLSAQPDYSVKGGRYLVLYLNRLLCPRFNLPLGYGSFRERRLREMLSWMIEVPAHRQRQSDQASLQL